MYAIEGERHINDFAPSMEGERHKVEMILLQVRRERDIK